MSNKVKNNLAALGVQQSEVEATNQGILENEQIKRAVTEDPLFKFLWNNRKALTWALIIVLGSMYLLKRVDDYKLAGYREASQVASEIQTEFNSYESTSKQLAEITSDNKETDQTKLEDLNTKLESIKTAISSKIQNLSSQGGNFANLAKAFEVLYAIKLGNQESVEKSLSKLDTSLIGSKDPGQSFYTELPYFSLAIVLQKDDTTKQKGESILKDLATKGVWLNVAAAKILNDQKIIEDIINKEPAQRDLLKN